MSDIDHFDERGDERGGLRGFVATRPTWQKALLVVSVVLMVAGGGLTAYAAFGPGGSDDPVASADGGGGEEGGTVDPSLVSGIGPGQPEMSGDGTTADPGGETPPDEGSPDEGAKTGAEVWSPAIFRLGFGFFAGFCLAAATRFLVKTIVIGAGVFLIMLFGLEQIDLITVNWEVMQTKGDAWLDTLGAQFQGLSAFFAGYLPTAGAGVAGAVIGFRK